MRYSKKYFIVMVLTSVLITVKTESLNAQAGAVRFIADGLPQLKKISTELNQNVLPLLALIKKIEESGSATTFKVAKIIKPQISVREADNLNSSIVVEARMNEEFEIIEERDKWYKIKTRDNREGWVAEEDVQLIVRPSGDAAGNLEKLSKQDASALLSQISRYKNIIEGLYADAVVLIKKMEEEYNSLSADNKKTVEPDYKTFLDYKEKIEKYHNYAIRYAKPYENFLISPGAPQPSKLAPGDRFKGTISADVGRSSYTNMNSNSTTSRRIALGGIYQIDKNTKLDFAVNHQNELIQTAFTNNTLDAGITRQFSDKMVLGANVNYNMYDDQVSDNNSFGLFRAGVNAILNPSRKANIFANAGFQSKNFKTTGNNDYEGILYVVGANLSPDSKNNIRIQIQGNKQSGEKDYLKFTQLSPQLIYTHKKTREKSFSFGLDYDILKYAETNNFNDYQKYKTDLRWRNKINDRLLSRTLNLTYKLYPNNSKQDYYRMGYVLEKRKGLLTGQKSSVSSLSYLVNIIANREDNLLKDYLDLRLDRSSVRPKGYSNMNILTRLWNNFEMIENDTSSFPDHYIDFYGEFGPYFRNISDGPVKVVSLKFGILMGGHLFFNFDEDYFKRNGNSVRTGIAASSNIKILKATLFLGGSYERSLILTKETTFDPISGNIAYGKDLFRKPSSFQFTVDFRQPVKNNLDIHFNLSTYDIRTDATFETSINPVEKKSNLRFSGGVLYRFAM